MEDTLVLLGNLSLWTSTQLRFTFRKAEKLLAIKNRIDGLMGEVDALRIIIMGLKLSNESPVQSGQNKNESGRKDIDLNRPASEDEKLPWKVVTGALLQRIYYAYSYVFGIPCGY